MRCKATSPSQLPAAPDTIITAISGAVGVIVALNSAEGNPLTGDVNSTDVSLAYADFSGGVGFTYYFR